MPEEEVEIPLDSLDLSGAEEVEIPVESLDLEGAEPIEVSSEGDVVAAPRSSIPIEQKTGESLVKKPTEIQSAVGGLLDALTFGYADELSGALHGALTDDTAGEGIDLVRERQSDLREENPKSYMAGQATGTLATLPLVGTSVPALAAAGALQGAGSAEGGLAERLTGGAIGGVSGVALGGAGKLATKAAGTSSRLAQKVLTSKQAPEIASKAAMTAGGSLAGGPVAGAIAGAGSHTLPGAKILTGKAAEALFYAPRTKAAGAARFAGRQAQKAFTRAVSAAASKPSGGVDDVYAKAAKSRDPKVRFVADTWADDPQKAAVYHSVMMRSDPQYRRAFLEAEDK